MSNDKPTLLRRLSVLGAAPALLTLSTIVLAGLMWSHLPSPAAVHWGFSGAPNGSGPRLLAAGAPIGLCLFGMLWAVIGAASWPDVPPTSWSTRRVLWSGIFLAGLGNFFAALGLAIGACTLAANYGATSWTDARSGAWVWAAPMLCLPATAAMTWALTRLTREWSTTEVATASAIKLELGTGERAVWYGYSHSRWVMFVSGGLVAAGAGLLATTLWEPGIAALVVAVVLLAFTSVRVTVNDKGLSVAYGALGIVLTRVPLRRVARAEVVEITMPSFGYRGSLALFGKAAVVTRRGPALSVELTDGKQFLVTVDDASTGAGLLTTLAGAGAHPAT
ncbi:MAG TPA: DUF1648 domain-containing protein [Acidimicrobiales bacterium]|nr:DUF1648 domain-containing protein [Acidimicrobiales bacterium]